MEILKHFERTDFEDIRIYRLNDDGHDNLINELTEDFRLSYISDNKLEELSEENKMSKSEFIERYIIPDIGRIKSGDFGEIFSFHSVIEYYRNKGIELKGPFKWMWKDRNKPAQYSDAILFHTNKKGNDFLISIESKMKATASKKHRIQQAIDGAENDRLSRLSKTLFWLEEKHAREGDVANRKLAERFGNPSKHGLYERIHKAITILDSSFENEEIEQEIVKDDKIIVIVFSFHELKQAYELTRQNIIDSVKEDG